MEEKYIAINEYLVVKKDEVDEDFFSDKKTEGLYKATITIENEELNFSRGKESKEPIKKGDRFLINPIGLVNVTLNGEELAIINYTNLVLACQ